MATITRTTSAALLFAAMLASAAVAAPADAWIAHPAASAPGVFEFARDVEFARRPKTLKVVVTADPRFTLYVNGQRVGSGPSTGTLQRWREADFDLAPFLAKGTNRISAVVWNFGPFAPLAQQSQSTGFRLTGGAFGTDSPGWRVRTLPGHRAASGAEQHRPEYYVASAPEIIDARVSAGAWVDAIAAPAAARTLIRDPLPPQSYRKASAGRVVRSTQSMPLPADFAALSVPANTHATFLLQRDAMITAYPIFKVRDGQDASIRVTYSEALYDPARKKADRNLIEDRSVLGLRDEFTAHGSESTFSPLWWRTWRYLELDITTQAQPLTLNLDVFETEYPFRQIGNFQSSDEELNRIFDIGWRTLRVDAHETFMDSAYWEQLQYAGDTRLEMLISYVMSGDARLGEQAIDAFAESDVEGGIMQGAYPSRGNNVITTFSLAWIAMLHDWYWQQTDAEPIRRHLPRSRRVLEWFDKLRTPSGLLGANPHWNFIDWAGQAWNDRTIFPSYGQGGGSCLMSVTWLGALEQAAELESKFGDAAIAQAHLSRSSDTRRAIREQCWDAKRGLFADNPDLNVFSQHMNALAVLYDVATPAEARDILGKIVVSGRGIDAPEGMFTTTYYFAWYLVRAFEHAGMGDRYHGLLDTWRGLMDLNYTTWPESRGDTRSDTHAWSAHPTADLLGLVAGIRPGAPAYGMVLIEPALGPLTTLSATAATPKGPVTVDYRIQGKKLRAEIVLPPQLRGEFRWRGQRYPLKRIRTTLVLDAP